MNLFGLSITRKKTLPLQEKGLSLVGVTGSRGWISNFMHELTAGGWQRNEDVRPETVLSNPTLYSCVTLIAGDIAKLRLKLVEQNASGLWNEVDIPAFSPFIRKPNSYQTRIDFIEWWLVSKLCRGAAIALKERDDRGVVVAAHLLDPCRVTPLVAPDGSVFYELYADELSGAEQVIVPAREVFHDVCCPLFHPLCGVPPIYAAGYPALKGLNIRTAQDKFFTNGSRPGGLLLVPGNISQTAADELKASWETNHGGDNVGKLAVLTGGMTYQPMAATAEQSQLVAQLGMTDEDVAKCFHMPRHKVGIGPDPTYNNIEALNQQYYADCLQKHMEKLEAVWDEGQGLVSVPGRKLGVEFERDDLFQMDSATRVSVAKEAMSAGASPDEVRKRWLDLSPTPGGDTPFLQEQNWPIRLLADRQMPSERPPTPPAEMPGEPPPTADSADAAAEKSVALKAEWRAKSMARGLAA